MIKSKSDDVKYIIIDLECTCWEKNDPLKDLYETIEIGAIFLNANFEKINQLQLYTLPEDNKILSEYCADLTGITQQTLDSKGIPFADAIKLLSEYIDEENEPVFGSWGEFDQRQLKEDCIAKGVDYPFSENNHVNIKVEFMKKYNKKRCGLQKVCRILQLRFNGSPHCGLDDANMTAEVFKKIRKEE